MPKPAHTQSHQPGLEYIMQPKPHSQKSSELIQGKLANRVAIITGGDSGIGRAVAIAYAQEGTHSVIVYLNETKDAQDTKHQVEKYGVKCLLLAGDVGQESFCKQVVKRTIRKFGKIDILINNAAEQHPTKDPKKISRQQLENTFRTNVFSFFFLTIAALPYLKKGSNIINTTSVTAYRGSQHLLDYSASKGAIVSFTRSLAIMVAEQGIRVNAVAPGPIWTPLIPSTFSKKHVEIFGEDTPLGRMGQPEEVAPSYVFLASDDASYMTGQVLHPNGGEIING